MTAIPIRIAVAVSADGNWSACGSEDRDDRTASRLALSEVGEPATVHFVTAEVEIPE